jgi:hypothetical protein
MAVGKSERDSRNNDRKIGIELRDTNWTAIAVLEN